MRSQTDFLLHLYYRQLILACFNCHLQVASLDGLKTVFVLGLRGLLYCVSLGFGHLPSLPFGRSHLLNSLALTLQILYRCATSALQCSVLAIIRFSLAYYYSDHRFFTWSSLPILARCGGSLFLKNVARQPLHLQYNRGVPLFLSSHTSWWWQQLYSSYLIPFRLYLLAFLAWRRRLGAASLAPSCSHRCRCDGPRQSLHSWSLCLDRHDSRCALNQPALSLSNHPTAC